MILDDFRNIAFLLNFSPKFGHITSFLVTLDVIAGLVIRDNIVKHNNAPYSNERGVHLKILNHSIVTVVSINE